MAELAELDKHGGDVFNPPLDIFSVLVDVRMTLHKDTYNFSAGIYEGMGPRYGASPIPGHNDAEPIVVPRCPGLEAAEGAPAFGMSDRRKMLGVVPLSLGSIAAPATKLDAYVWIVTKAGVGGQYVSVQVGTTSTETSQNIYDGFVNATIDLNDPVNYNNFLFEAMATQAGSRTNAIIRALLHSSGKFYASIAVVSVSGQNIPMGWYAGEALTPGDATHAPKLALQKCTIMEVSAATLGTIELGVPTQFNLQNYSAAGRNLNVYTMDVNGDFNSQYVVLVNPSPTTFKMDVIGAKTVNLDIDGIVATRVVAGTPANTVAALVEDGLNFQSSAYKAVLMASGKAFATLFQDSYSATDFGGTTVYRQQVVDLTNTTWEPRSINPTAAGNHYTEDTRKKTSPFQYWPAFVRGTEMTNFGGVTNFAVLGGANTGILRKNTVYEFTYAVFNKRLGFETNVCANPVKIQIGAVNDFQSIKLFDAGGAPGGHTTIFAYHSQLQLAFMPFNSSNTTLGSFTGSKQFLNFLEYRFYFRQEGTYEWLPALSIDAAKFWFFPFNILSACTGPIAALPGGQPGSISDYSPLPTDSYDCVVTYKDRAFWFSEANAVFSLRNNIFAYPLRNNIPIQGGKYRGAIVHNYPGQAQQNSRLIVVGDTTIFVGRFTGERTTTVVQVSTETSADIPVDGSDFVLDPWTSNTAFSSRALAIADGILFWWGPDGLFRDGGVATPERISPDLEPDIFRYYNPARTAEIFAQYNAQTKEIIWFYPPKTTDSFATHALVFNVASNQFYPMKFVAQIDWASNIEVKTAIGTAGKRGIIGVRSDDTGIFQRAYFFDNRNRSGDMRPTTDFLVKTATTPSAGVRRLTLAAGYGTVNFATIVAGDFIAIQQAASYAGADITRVDDMVCVVSAIDTGAGTIDILIPTGAVFDASFNMTTFSRYIPIWHKAKAAAGLNAIAYQMKTNYWTPFGLSYAATWFYLHFVFRVVLWFQTRAPTTTETYRTPVSTAAESDELEFRDNADGYCEILHPHKIGERAIEGQGLQFALSGFHIGHEWVLESVTAYTSGKDQNHLKEFEG